MNKYDYIKKWTEDDLESIPRKENDEYEYKSSRTSDEALKGEISKTASAFWNSGGGILIVGVNDNGIIDGGITENVGRELREEWAEKIVYQTEPAGPFFIKTIKRNTANSQINNNNIVLIVVFGVSLKGPHMANNKKYYIRAGSKSEPASHFIVEAIRAKRELKEPKLRGTLRITNRDPNIVELVVAALNDSPALNVEISFDPLTKAFSEHLPDSFPLKIPFIDKQNPFVMDISTFPNSKQVFGESPVNLILHYLNLTGKPFNDKQPLSISENLGPMQIGTSVFKEVKKTLNKISDTLSRYLTR